MADYEDGYDEDYYFDDDYFYVEDSYAMAVSWRLCRLCFLYLSKTWLLDE